MRSKALREGSVGLFIIAGIVALAGSVLWVNNVKFTKSTYTIQVEFDDTNGMKPGAMARFRGFEVGQITEVKPTVEGIEVTIEINSLDLQIPVDSLIEANQSGLIGETTVDFSPISQDIPPEALNMTAVSKNCNPQLIICEGMKLKGVVGSSLQRLIRSTTVLSQRFETQEFYDNINQTLKSANVVATEVAKLSDELRNLSKTFRQEIDSLSTASNSIAASADRTSVEFIDTINKVEKSISNYGNTADELTNLASNVNSLITENRINLNDTLINISDTSSELKTIVASVSPIATELGNANLTTLIANLETLIANSNEASNNLKNFSATLGDPTNLVMLQETLDSARATFANVQKISADIDQVTGNPQFRQDMQDLIEGLSNLVSSTQDLDQQMQVATVLEYQQKNPGNYIETSTLIALEKDLNQIALKLNTPSQPTLSKDLNKPLKQQ
jgi:phospholipid/cholesterol/gamma-HCH transport system substrate-binding protein